MHDSVVKSNTNAVKGTVNTPKVLENIDHSSDAQRDIKNVEVLTKIMLVVREASVVHFSSLPFVSMDVINSNDRIVA